MDVVSSIGGLAVGRSLRSVRLVGPFVAGPVDEAREVADVELDLGGAFLRFGWRLDGVDERLVFEWGSDSEVQDGVVSDAAGDWHGLIGDEIAGIRMSTHISDESLPPSIWAITLECRERRSVTIALGELDESDKPVYMPDSIVLIFDQREAESFRPPAAIESAWGTRVVFPAT